MEKERPNWELYKIFADYASLKQLHKKIKSQKASVHCFRAIIGGDETFMASIRFRDKGYGTSYTGQHKSFGMIILEVLAIIERKYNG